MIPSPKTTDFLDWFIYSDNNVFSEGELEKNNNTHFLRFFAPFYELTDFSLFRGGDNLNRFNN